MRSKFTDYPLFAMLCTLFVLITLFGIWGCDQKAKNYIEDYYPLVYKGDLAFFKEEYDQSFRLLREAVEMLEPPNFEPYRELEKLANLAARLGEHQIALDYLGQLIDRGYPLETFLRDTTYASLWQLPEGDALKDNYSQLRASYEAKIKHALREQVRKMNEEDQRYRSRPDRHQFREEQLRLDSMNIAQLREIFEKWGYPGPQLIGHIPPDSTEQLGVINILMRTDGDVRQEYFIPKMKTFVANGTCPPHDLGLLIDQYYLTQDGFQLYATMFGPKGLFPIKDRQKLDERRLSIGLPTLKMEMQRDSVIRMSLYMEQLMGKD